ncbi:unnamed protein product, partial [marine sediment metagenome]
MVSGQYIPGIGFIGEPGVSLAAVAALKKPPRTPSAAMALMPTNGVTQAPYFADTAGAEATQGAPVNDTLLPPLAAQEAAQVMPVAYNGTALPGSEVTDGMMAPTPGAMPVALPLVAGVGALSLGVLRSLLIRFGPTILKAMIGAAAFSWVLNAIGIGLGDDTP